VNPESLAPRYSLPQRSESQLLRASGKVIQQRVQELADTSTSLLLADRNGLVLEIWSGDKDLARELDRSHSAPGYIMEESVVGTNGVGTVLEDGLPVRIAGGEHFADAWQEYTCVGVPIRHPHHPQVAGRAQSDGTVRRRQPPDAAVRHAGGAGDRAAALPPWDCPDFG
jgi:transcriptional regulator of acetoin/glycerol metabolism